MCVLYKTKDLRCDNSQREEKKGEKKSSEERKAQKKSKISPEGTDVAASLRKKRRRFSRKVFAFLSSKKNEKK